MDAPNVASSPVIVKQGIPPLNSMPFYLNNAKDSIGWHQFNWYTENPDQANVPITLISKSYIRDTDTHGYGMELTFFNLSADKEIYLTVEGHYLISRGLVLIDHPRELINKENHNMDNNNMASGYIYTDFTDTLTLVPGDARPITITSPNGQRIVDVFHFDPTGKNAKTSLTGKLRVTSTEWRLFFFNADPLQSVTLNFEVVTSF